MKGNEKAVGTQTVPCASSSGVAEALMDRGAAEGTSAGKPLPWNGWVLVDRWQWEQTAHQDLEEDCPPQSFHLEQDPPASDKCPSSQNREWACWMAQVTRSHLGGNISSADAVPWFQRLEIPCKYNRETISRNVFTFLKHSSCWEIACGKCYSVFEREMDSEKQQVEGSSPL